MSHPTTAGTNKRWKASELRRLPADQRNAILAATEAQGDYEHDPALTDFEAFGKEDLHGDNASAQTK